LNRPCRANVRPAAIGVALLQLGHSPQEKRVREPGVDPQCAVEIGYGLIEITKSEIGEPAGIEDDGVVQLDRLVTVFKRRLLTEEGTGRAAV
jgi:hypothetical protein